MRCANAALIFHKRELWSDEDAKACILALSHIQYYVALQLNPEEDHLALKRAMNQLHEKIAGGDWSGDRDEYNQYETEIVARTQSILKTEWDRVKAGY